MKRYLTILLILMLPLNVAAQFYVTGDDPGKLKWNTIDTDNFKLIYPQGADSLAQEYGRALEKYRIPVSRSTGYLGGGPGKLRMPVVMHTYNTSNGSVAWAPRRMDLFTIPSTNDPEPLPWMTMLAVHEGRHVTQMQFGMTQAHKPIGWFFGEMWNILASLLYPGLSFIEGDAVIAETALTNSGRGRTADFLNYYQVAFDNGDFRRWDQWRLGSQRRYAPDHYALGYLTVGGMRYLYDCPSYMEAAYRLSARNPLNLGAFYTVTRQMTGKRQKEAFQETCRHMHGIWKAQADARAPFIPSEPVTAEPRLYTDYMHTTISGNDLYTVKSGHETAPVLIRIDSTGKEHKVSRFAYGTSGLKAAPQMKRLYWSENMPDERWTMKTDSRIRYISLNGGDKKSLTGTSDLLFNPSYCQGQIASVRFHVDGSASVAVVNAISGETQMSVKVPSGLQPNETAWLDGKVYVSAISDKGFGIYCFDGTGWSETLAPQPVKIKDLGSREDFLMFTCDRTGVNELYHMYPSSNRLVQKTVTRYGAEDFAYSEDGKWLYYSSQTIKGKQIFRTAYKDLVDREADFTQIHNWPIAEKLASQEKILAQKDGFSESVTETSPSISQPKRYRKIPNMFNVHSWAPVYVNIDNIMNMSFEQMWQAASLGATGIMQNALATAVGEFGYSAHKDPYNTAKWRHSAHARLTWSGWYPVIEAAVDFNDRAARQWSSAAYIMNEGASLSLTSRELDVPYIEGRLSMYIPFDFSSGGWYKGVVPKVTYRVGNDKFNTSLAVVKTDEIFAYDSENEYVSGRISSFAGHKDGKNTFRHSMSGSIRAYTMLNTPNSAVYPKWGLGVEFGASGSFESSEYLSPMGYGYVYGYIPGLISTHGIRISVMKQIKLSDAPFGQTSVNCLPRGLSSNGALLNALSVRNTSMTKASFDYAFPIYIGDLAIGGNFFSIKRLVMNPHFDYMTSAMGRLHSAGAELRLDLHSILTLEWPCSIGVTYSFNGGDTDAISKATGATIGRHYIGPTFNVTF